MTYVMNRRSHVFLLSCLFSCAKSTTLALPWRLTLLSVSPQHWTLFIYFNFFILLLLCTICISFLKFFDPVTKLLTLTCRPPPTVFCFQQMKHFVFCNAQFLIVNEPWRFLLSLYDKRSFLFRLHAFLGHGWIFGSISLSVNFFLACFSSMPVL